MNKGVILLTKASNEDEAVSNVREFLEDYGDSKVWDWYVVGGRWSGTLNPKTKEFFEKAEAHFKAVYPQYAKDEFLTSKMVEEQGEALNGIWDTIGGEGLNPFSRDNYSSDGFADDVLPLTECLDVVNAWTKDMNVHAEEMWSKMIEAKSTDKGHDMSAYFANRYAEAKYDEFCFESNVYVIDHETNNPASAIENADQYFAVMVDMHN